MRRANINAVRALLVAGVLLFSPSSPGLAQDRGLEHTKLSEAEIEAFATSYLEVGRILYSCESRLEEARTAEEGKDIYSEALSAMLRALNDQGLTDSRYFEIFEIARADDTLLDKIVRSIEAKKR
jgi:Domain of unknown function (DUF4168)